MYRNKIRSLTFPAVLSSSLLIYNAECEKDRGELVLATAQRLKHGLTMDHLRLSQTTVDGIEVYIPKGNFGRFSKEGLSVARVAATEIRCNYKEIITLWQDQLHRKDWDASCSTVVPVKPNDQTSVESENTQLSHFVERSAFFIPSRDYVIHVMEPYPAALVGRDTFTSLVLVSIDASDAVPRSWLYVRGKQNSILVLEPKGEHSTTVTFCIEKEPMGWAVGSLLANMSLGSSPVLVLRDLKKALEKENIDEDGALSVEEIARKRFKEKLELAKKENSIGDDLIISKDDLRAIIQNLELKLIRVVKTEALEKIDLSDLKSRIQSDINKAKNNLNQLRK